MATNLSTTYLMLQKLLLPVFFAIGIFSNAQTARGIINPAETNKILTVLSADDMAGRKTGTPGIDKAAAYIAAQFKAAGLQPAKGANGFLQRFEMIKPVFKSIRATVNGQPLPDAKVIAFFSGKEMTMDERSGFKKETIIAGKNLLREAQRIIALKKNSLVLVDTSFENAFAGLARLKRMQFATPYNTVFLLINEVPEIVSVQASQDVEIVPMANIVGILPGKSKPGEMVIFSGHYDHLGIGKTVNGDSIYNGANDDASGTTAVIMLAKYFKARGNNKRTIVFAAFTAEEIGGYGSQYFSRQMDAGKVAAMFNIEMIGTESKWGKASAYITGFEKTDMGSILSKNLKGTEFSFYPDPYPDQQLFYRSDNATLARLGVPAHTISTSKMDNEPNYHKVTDEIGTMDTNNMTAIIKAIAISASSIIKGTDTPQRVKVDELTR